SVTPPKGKTSRAGSASVPRREARNRSRSATTLLLSSATFRAARSDLAPARTGRRWSVAVLVCGIVSRLDGIGARCRMLSLIGQQPGHRSWEAAPEDARDQRAGAEARLRRLLRARDAMRMMGEACRVHRPPDWLEPPGRRRCRTMSARGVVKRMSRT